MTVIGVTGTNGKTSTVHLLAQALHRAGHAVATIGTLGAGLAGDVEAGARTTPDAIAVQGLLATFREKGATHVAMEVSSHALDQGRINAVAFDLAVFTNLTRDHLDYHGTMAAYGQAKARLFEWPGLAAAVINADDAFGQRLIDAARARGQRVVTYGLASADISATAIAMAERGIALSIASPWGRGTVETQVVGAFNAYNLLGVLGVLVTSGVAFDEALDALAALTPPPGRMQRLGGGGKPLVVIDYAHSPDALLQALVALRPAVAAARELVCVFGCGGDRDKGKRPEMGRIAATEADRVVVTTDNARSEAPEAIAADIVRGIRQTGARRWSLELDRGAAIRAAVAGARAGDVVLIAGKGHETYQEAQGERVPFSDGAEAAAGLAAWSGA